MLMNKTCVAFGEFEFIHKGHIKIAETVVAVAKEQNLTPVIVCFEREGKVYTTEEEKEYLLKSVGIEIVLSFGNVRAEGLIGILGVEVIVVGEQHAELDLVKAIAENYDVDLIVVPAVEVDGEIVSTELLEQAYESSDYERITDMCGHPYIMIGEVVHGKKLGRTENMPTANIEVASNKRKPKHAVYGGRIRLGEEVLEAVVNIGKRPTVDDFNYTTIEALIFDFERQIYGEKLILEVHKYVRGIKKFNSLAEVKEQVDEDVKEAKKFLKTLTLTK